MSNGIGGVQDTLQTESSPAVEIQCGQLPVDEGPAQFPEVALGLQSATPQETGITGGPQAKKVRVRKSRAKPQVSSSE